MRRDCGEVTTFSILAPIRQRRCFISPLWTVMLPSPAWGIGDRAGRTGEQRGGVMELRSRSAGALHRSRPGVPCAQCGKTLFAPEWSEYLDDRHIRHLWSCDACGYEF